MSCNVTWCNFVGDLPDKEDPTSQFVQWEISLGTFSNWLNQQILLTWFEQQAPTLPTQLYVGLHTTASDANNPGTELSGDGYTRTPVSFTNISQVQSWNPTLWSSSTATADWPGIVSLTLWDAQTGGNYYAFGNMSGSVDIVAGGSAKIPANKMVVGVGSC